MSARHTCSACRTKKVRCDGETPACGTCRKARGRVECVYERSRPSIPSGPLLQRGAACLACRAKKKKCDAKRPYCGPCKIAGYEDDCQYKDARHRSRTQQLNDHIGELEARVKAFEQAAETNSQLPVDTSQVLNAVPPLELFTDRTPPSIDWDSTSLGVALPPQSNYNRLDIELSGPVTTPMSIPSQATSSLLSSPALLSSEFPAMTSLSPAIERPIVISALDPRKLRSAFLSHHAQLGFDVPPAKLTAILAGDLSNTIVHPVLVYVAQLWGCVLAQDGAIIPLANLELVQLQAVIELLGDEGSVQCNPVAFLQASFLLGLYFLIKDQFVIGVQYFRHAASIVVKYNLQVILQVNQAPFADSNRVGGNVDVVQSMESFTAQDEVQEQNGALCELFYLDQSCMLLWNLPTLMNQQLILQIERLLVTSQSLVAVRSLSVFFLREVRHLSPQWADLSSATQGLMNSSQWFPRYWDLLKRVSQSIAILTPLLLKASFYNEREAVLALKVSLIILHTAMAELYRLLASTHPDSLRLCLDAIDQILSIAFGIPDADYIMLDPILLVCWTSAGNVLLDIESTFNTLSPLFHNPSFISAKRVELNQFKRKLRHTFPFLEVTHRALCEEL